MVADGIHDEVTSLRQTTEEDNSLGRREGNKVRTRLT